MEPSEDDLAKELTRKLFWAVSSTVRGLNKQQRTSTFNWASHLAGRIVSGHPSLPPPVDSMEKNRYHGQAEGRGGGRNNLSLPKGATPPPPPDMEGWLRKQEEMRERAWSYVMRTKTWGVQLPIPEEAYREVKNGSRNSTG